MNGSVCILYGLGEGPVIGKVLLNKLQEYGFEIIADASQADFIIAHSGGMFFLPKTYRAKLFLLVGVNNGFEESMFHIQYRKFKLDITHAVRAKLYWYWLKKSFWNAFYMTGQLQRTLHMWRIAHGEKPLLPIIKNARVIIVNYKDDPWSGHLSEEELNSFPQYKLITRTGIHDDIWINPHYYIKLLHAGNK